MKIHAQNLRASPIKFCLTELRQLQKIYIACIPVEKNWDLLNRITKTRGTNMSSNSNKTITSNISLFVLHWWKVNSPRTKQLLPLPLMNCHSAASIPVLHNWTSSHAGVCKSKMRHYASKFDWLYYVQIKFYNLLNHFSNSSQKCLTQAVYLDKLPRQ